MEIPKWPDCKEKFKYIRKNIQIEHRTAGIQIQLYSLIVWEEIDIVVGSLSEFQIYGIHSHSCFLFNANDYSKKQNKLNLEKPWMITNEINSLHVLLSFYFRFCFCNDSLVFEILIWNQKGFIHSFTIIIEK